MARYASLPKLNILIGLLMVVAIGLGVLLYRDRTNTYTLPKNDRSLKKYAIGSFVIRGKITKREAERITSFLTQTVKESLRPKELVLRPAPTPQGQNIPPPPTYMGNWNIDGKYLSFLYGLTADKKQPAYYRVWTMTPGSTVTTAQAREYLGSLIAETQLAKFGEVSCKETVDPGTQKPVTECAALKTEEDGTLMGITVRAPVVIDQPKEKTQLFPVPPQTVIITSACLIPKEGTEFYQASSCI